jgi:FtsH-binding integral membrane protein
MFLPDYIEYSFDNATINSKPIVKQKVSVYEAIPEGIPFSFFHPWIVFGLFLSGVIILSYFDWKNKSLTKWFDIVLFFVVGLVGVLLLLLWTATDHKAAATNFNLLWAFPFHVIWAVMLIKKQPPFWTKRYFEGTWILLGATLLLWFVIPQQLNVFLIPVVAALMIRAWLISKLLVK